MLLSHLLADVAKRGHTAQLTGQGLNGDRQFKQLYWGFTAIDPTPNGHEPPANPYVTLLLCLHMADLPREFHEKYENRGDTFFEIAQILLDNHGRQYTQSNLANKVDISQSRVSTYTQKLVDENWINRHDGQTTFVWNTEEHNPAEMAGNEAVFGLYQDLFDVFKNHTQTLPGALALGGFCFFVTAFILLFIYLILKSGLVSESALPLSIYLLLGLGFAISGVVITGFTYLQAFMNRVWNRILGRPSRD